MSTQAVLAVIRFAAHMPVLRVLKLPALCYAPNGCNDKVDAVLADLIRTAPVLEELVTRYEPVILYGDNESDESDAPYNDPSQTWPLFCKALEQNCRISSVGLVCLQHSVVSSDPRYQYPYDLDTQRTVEMITAMNRAGRSYVTMGDSSNQHLGIKVLAATHAQCRSSEAESPSAAKSAMSDVNWTLLHLRENPLLCRRRNLDCEGTDMTLDELHTPLSLPSSSGHESSRKRRKLPGM
jgi:hypothetical protein